MSTRNGRVDLHLHTTRSDGHYSPRQLIDKLAAFEFQAVAISDHDEIGAISEVRSYAQTRGIEVIPGVELSVDFGGRDIHVLGYCFDPEHEEFLNYLSVLRNERIRRARKIVNKLSDLGMPLPFDQVLEKAGAGSIGRPHIAFALLDHGYVESFKEAFNKYIGDGKPAYVGKFSIDIKQALRTIKSAGGLCSIAHPGLQLSTQDLMLLIKTGVSAIEVVHPKHDEEHTRFYAQFAAEHGLLSTGGSDFHGGNKGEEALGRYTVSYDVVQEMKQQAEFYRNEN